MFYFIRHGEPDCSFCGKTIFKGIGQHFIPLTLNGRAQIIETAKDKRLSDAAIIISSPYTRALQSAAILSKELQLDLFVEPDLFEWYEDRNYNVYESFPESRLQEFIDHNGDYPEGGAMPWENNEMMRARIFNVLPKYTDCSNVIVVCHGILIRSLTPWKQNRFPEYGEIVEFEYKGNEQYV